MLKTTAKSSSKPNKNMHNDNQNVTSERTFEKKIIKVQVNAHLK